MSECRFDLDQRSREALDLEELLAWLAEFARSAPGRARVLATWPSCEPTRLSRALDTLREVGRLLDEQGAPVPGSLPDPEPAVGALAVVGRRLDALELRDLAAVVSAAADLGSGLRSLDPTVYPELQRRGAAFPDLRGESAEVARCIGQDGTLADEASHELRRIRQARARSAERLKRRLESILHRPGAAAMVQDDFITQRSGRFVIPVRSDAPHPVQGIVHASSSSGATRFVEPLETVELNNEIVHLAELEQQETDRLLLAWTEMFRDRREEVGQAVSSLADLDALQARALFARELDAVLPEVATDGPLVFDQVRHPLLERRLREQGSGCVPLTITLDPPDRVLVLSGPNAGGKTVALKTFGLAVLMAQSGIPVPARRVRLPLYRQIRADIGDHQSIQADLSTYSAHITAVAEFLTQAAPPLLFLFDEIGGGTDPQEGAALARSILESLRRPRITAVATTHQSALKSWAFTADGALSAAMEFDTERLAPTYRVIVGAAGVSAGLEIARRVGLPGDVIERARAALGGDTRQAEDYLNRLHTMTVEMEARRFELDRQREELEAQRERERRWATERSERDGRRIRGELDRALQSFRKEARKQLSEIRDRRELRRAERKLARVEDGLRAEQVRLGRELGAADEDEQRAVPQSIEPGMEVYVRSLGRHGRVQNVAGTRVEVLMGRMPFTVDRSEIRGPRAGGDPGGGAASRPERPRRADPHPEVEVPVELMLIGKTVDDALDELDKFLDSATVAGLGQVRVIHGHGTGRLRRAVREFLARHALVRGTRAGKSYEGGDGATVVDLK